MDDYLIQDVDKDVIGAKRLDLYIANLSNTQVIYDQLFKNMPSAEGIPENTSKEVKSALLIMDDAKLFVNKFEIVKNEL